MPTPSVEAAPAPSFHEIIASVNQHRSLRATCPPEDDCLPETLPFPATTAIDAPIDGPPRSETPPSQGAIHIERAESSSPAPSTSRSTPQQDSETDGESTSEAPSPAPVSNPFKPATISTSDPSSSGSSSSTWGTSISQLAPPFGNPDSHRKTPPRYYSSYLKAGSIFQGTQQSDRQIYNVQVEIKHVDMSQSFVCGYLRIEGLTSEHPTLTTYFEGEIIGTKYSFLTSNSSWGSSEKTDMQHWARFPAWKPLQRAARRPDFNFKNFAERDTLFMRWKEYFLVPDHRVRTISGASFEGFYYIAFDQREGGVSGIYFHSKSEKFQQLELKHVDDHGCRGAMEFR